MYCSFGSVALLEAVVFGRVVLSGAVAVDVDSAMGMPGEVGGWPDLVSALFPDD